MENKKYLILTFGCQMNVHESEKLAGILESNGYEVCDNAVEADIVVFNTCAIRENAEQKIFGNIGELKNIKIAKPDMLIAIGGCMSQQNGYADEILKRFPFVDIVFGTHNLGDFENLLKERVSSNKKISSIVETEEIAVRDAMKKQEQVVLMLGLTLCMVATTSAHIVLCHMLEAEKFQGLKKISWLKLKSF